MRTIYDIKYKLKGLVKTGRVVVNSRKEAGEWIRAKGGKVLKIRITKDGRSAASDW